MYSCSRAYLEMWRQKFFTSDVMGCETLDRKLILVLLLIGCVELNPGPQKKKSSKIRQLQVFKFIGLQMDGLIY